MFTFRDKLITINLMNDFNIGLITAGGFWMIISILIVWSLIWKGIALWYSAKNKEKYWFIGLFLINTLGILEIIYLVFVAKIFTKQKPNYSIDKIKQEEAKPVLNQQKEDLSEDKKIASIDK